MPEPVYTSDWTTRHFPKWREVLAPWIGKEKARGLELGTHEGRSAIFFLTEVLTHSTSRLVCADHWYSRDVLGRFLYNLMTEDVHDRCELRRGDSHLTLRSMRQKFDFIYVDADHRAEAVLTDAVLAWPLLHTGGVLIFDDYLWDHTEDALPKVGIDAFLSAFAGKYELLHKEWQVILKKI